MDENSENEIMKKRVCKKLAKELIKHYHISKKDAEYVAINLENRVRNAHSNNIDSYKSAIVTLVRHIEVFFSLKN